MYKFQKDAVIGAIDKIENKSIDYSIKIQGYFNFPAMLIYKDKRPVRAGTSSEQETIVTELSNMV